MGKWRICLEDKGRYVRAGNLELEESAGVLHFNGAVPGNSAEHRDSVLRNASDDACLFPGEVEADSSRLLAVHRALAFPVGISDIFWNTAGNNASREGRRSGRSIGGCILDGEGSGFG